VDEEMEGGDPSPSEGQPFGRESSARQQIIVEGLQLLRVRKLVCKEALPTPA
jgi:hypothetical protein